MLTFYIVLIVGFIVLVGGGMLANAWFEMGL